MYQKHINFNCKNRLSKYKANGEGCAFKLHLYLGLSFIIDWIKKTKLKISVFYSPPS